jgi:PAS domain S-box-containing protein
MADSSNESNAQRSAEAAVDVFRQQLGPFVVAAERTRMPMVFTDARPKHSIIFANDAFLALTGFAREEVLANSFNSLLAGSDSKDLALVEAAFRDESSSDPEVHYRRKDGSEFWASLLVSPVCNEGGLVAQYFVSLVDLTRHRNEVAQSKMLIDELNHRVKNTLSTVQAIVTQTLHRAAEPAAQEAIESRLLALARSHDLLTLRRWESAGLRQLVDTALKPFEVVSGHAHRIRAIGEDAHLSPKTALALAIGLHELATNAVKYGALSNDTGTVAIEWEVVWGAEENKLKLRWQETGGPPVAPPTRKGFGSWVIERGLAHELGGDISLDYASEGVVCTMAIPLASLRADR